MTGNTLRETVFEGLSQVDRYIKFEVYSTTFVYQYVYVRTKHDFLHEEESGRVDASNNKEFCELIKRFGFDLNPQEINAYRQNLLWIYQSTLRPNYQGF